MFRRLSGAALPMTASVVLGLLHLRALDHSPLLRYLTVDLEAYDQWARRIAAGDWLGSGVFYQDPLYPYFMALVYAIGGSNVLHVLLVQIAAAALTILLVHRLAGALFSPATAVAAAWMLALYRPAIFYAAKPEKACLSALGVTAALWAIVRASQTPSPRRFALVGALLGLVTLLRGNVLLVAGLVVQLVGWTDWIVTTRRRAALLGLAAGLAMILLPVLARNYVLAGDWVLTTSQAGANLFLGNHPGNRTGSYAAPGFVRASPRFEQSDFERHAEAVEGRPLLPSEVSRFYVREVASWALREPGAFLRLQILKMRAFVNAWELPDNWSIDFVRRYSPILDLPMLAFGLVFPLSVLGAARIVLGRHAARWLVVVASFYAVTVVVFFVFSRYRYAIAPALVILAAHGLVETGALVRRRAWRSLGAAALIVALAGIAAHARPTIDPAADLSHRFFNLAASLFEDGRLSEAESLCLRAVEIHAGNGLALFTLAQIAARRGDAALEAEYLARAQTARPLDPDILSRRVKALADRGDYAPAVAILEAAIAQGGATAQTWQFLANVHFLSGDKEMARLALKRGLALEPGNPLLRQNLDALTRTTAPE